MFYSCDVNWEIQAFYVKSLEGLNQIKQNYGIFMALVRFRLEYFTNV